LPRMFDIRVRPTSGRIGDQPRALFPARQLLDDLDSGLTEGHVTGLSGLGHRDEPDLPTKVDVLPFRFQQLVLPSPCK